MHRLILALIKFNNNNNNIRIHRCNSRYFTISWLHHEPSPTCMLKWARRNCVQIMCNTLSAYHVQHVMFRAMGYEWTAQLLSLTEFTSHLFELYFIGWTISRWRRVKNPEQPEKSPCDELQKMPHTKARRLKPQVRLEPAQQHWWQARKAGVLTVTPRIALAVKICEHKHKN